MLNTRMDQRKRRDIDATAIKRSTWNANTIRRYRGEASTFKNLIVSNSLAEYYI